MSKIRVLKNVRVTCTNPDLSTGSVFLIATRYYETNKLIDNGDKYDVVLSDGTILHGLYKDVIENYGTSVESGNIRSSGDYFSHDWLV